MTQSFLAAISETPDVPVSAPTPDETSPKREPLKHLLIGSLQILHHLQLEAEPLDSRSQVEPGNEGLEAPPPVY
jgi:hypothetical protein